MSACEEETGRPKYQVMRFQAIAPARPARITRLFTTAMSIMPLPIVFATRVPRRKAATKLKNAAQRTASCGERTRVETTVAIEFAASWKPFRKSKASATAMMKTRLPKPGGMARDLGVLHHDVADDVRVVLALVAGLLQPLVDLLPLEDLEGVPAVAAEEVGDDGAVELVGLVLEVGDAHRPLADARLVAEVPEEGGDGRDLRRHLDEDLGELAERLGRLLELEEDEVVRHRLE